MKDILPKKINISEYLDTELKNYYCEKSNSYKGLIKLISNPYNLAISYSLIKSNPGNMTKGTTPLTLDGLN